MKSIFEGKEINSKTLKQIVKEMYEEKDKFKDRKRISAKPIYCGRE